jgi:hypothetical protein
VGVPNAPERIAIEQEIMVDGTAGRITRRQGG